MEYPAMHFMFVEKEFIYGVDTKNMKFYKGTEEIIEGKLEVVYRECFLEEMPKQFQELVKKVKP
jgi:hypothetical protein